MAKRHEDRKPGSRVQRGPTNKPTRPGNPANPNNPNRPAGPNRSGKPSRPGGPGNTNRPGKPPHSERSGSERRGPERRGPDARGRGGNDDLPTRSGPPGKRPVRTSKRRASGLVVTEKKGNVGAGLGDGKVRLNHFLAMSGVCSRRSADGLIAGGRVLVNGELVRELGVRVDPQNDDVRFDGNRVQPERTVYVLFNKPKGVVCTNARHEQKKRVVDCLPQVRGRLFTVGRLDLDSEGLIIVTNDGAFALEMTHPRFGVPKLYSVVVRGRVEAARLEKARDGIWLAEGPTAGMNIKIDRVGKDRTFLKATLREGKNREIRRVFAKIGYPVISLKRVRIGDLTLHGLPEGGFRFLELREVRQLQRVARKEDAAIVE